MFIVSAAPYLWQRFHQPENYGKHPARQEKIDLRSIDVNRADAVILEKLPGIGPVLAARIMEERRRGGPYLSLRDLERVKGIGPATAKALEPYVIFGR